MFTWQTEAYLRLLFLVFYLHSLQLCEGGELEACDNLLSLGKGVEANLLLGLVVLLGGVIGAKGESLVLCCWIIGSLGGVGLFVG